MICPVFPRERDGLSGVQLHQTRCSDHSGPPALPNLKGRSVPQEPRPRPPTTQAGALRSPGWGEESPPEQLLGEAAGAVWVPA